MGNFKQIGGKRFNSNRPEGFKREGNRPTYAPKSWSGSNDRDRSPVTMHRATCAQCGNSCEVPFRPMNGKMVYCADCFQGKRENSDDRGGNRYPEKRSNNYESHGESHARDTCGKENNDRITKQLEILNIKMDKLIKAVESMANTKS